MNPRPDPPVTPRPAATVILVRDPYEVLMVQRSTTLAFMAGYWVFPGGKVEDDDGSPEAAARRELQEEVAITLAPEAELIPFARWITPEGLPRRFDTYFFLAEAAGADGADAPRVDDSEIVAAAWLAPHDALSNGSALAFPTRKLLEELSAFTAAAELLAAGRDRTVEPVLPIIVRDDGSPATVRLPGQSGPGETLPEVV